MINRLEYLTSLCRIISVSHLLAKENVLKIILSDTKWLCLKGHKHLFSISLLTCSRSHNSL